MEVARADALGYDAPVRIVAALLIVLAAAWTASPARAGDGRPVVVLVRPTSPSPMIDEMLRRTQAELTASGFDVRIVDGTPGAAPRTAIEAADAQAIAAIAIVDPEGEATVEVWVDDRLSGKMSIRPLVANEPDEHKAAAVLAIQAVELLRASLIEITRSAPTPAAEPPPRPTPPRAAVAFAQRGLAAPPPPAPRRAELALTAGPSAFLGFDPLGIQIAPTFAVAVTAPSGFGGRLRWMGPGWGPDVDVEGGGVALSPWMLTAGALYAPRTQRRWFAYGAIDAGLFHLDAGGTLVAPATGRSGSAFAAAFLGGAGGGLRLTDSVALVVEAQLLLTAPRITVEVGGDSVAIAGRPWAVTTLGIQLSR